MYISNLGTREERRDSACCNEVLWYLELAGRQGGNRRDMDPLQTLRLRVMSDLRGRLSQRGPIAFAGWPLTYTILYFPTRRPDNGPAMKGNSTGTHQTYLFTVILYLLLSCLRSLVSSTLIHYHLVHLSHHPPIRTTVPLHIFFRSPL